MIMLLALTEIKLNSRSKLLLPRPTHWRHFENQRCKTRGSAIAEEPRVSDTLYTGG